MNILYHQYELVKSSREVVLAYCEAMNPEHYTTQVDNFGKGGTIRHLQMHIANTYIYWLDYFGMNNKPVYYFPDDIPSVQAMRQAFETVDSKVSAFIEHFANRPFELVTNMMTNPAMESTYEAVTLFTHTITHETHHKGQIMSMGRILGYTPPDADLIRLE